MANVSEDQSVQNSVIYQLVPALIQCFGIILTGYFTGRFAIMTETQIKGLGVYVTKFALPAMFLRVCLACLNYFIFFSINIINLKI